MSSAAQPFYEAVRVDLGGLLDESSLSASYREILDRALRQDGKVLSDSPRSAWPLLVLLPAGATRRDWRSGLPVASAAELVGLSTDIFDEIEDGDESPLSIEFGQPRALNAAFGLLVLAAKSLQHLPANLGAPLIEGVLRAADGQDRDLGGSEIATVPEYLSAIDRKAAALISGCCEAGALLAGLGGEAAAAYARFGAHYGRMAQILNDLRGAVDPGKGSLAGRLGTLQYVFALGGQEAPIREAIREHLAESDRLTPKGSRNLRRALVEAGAYHFCWAMAETEHAHASECLASALGDAAPLLASLLLPANRPIDWYLSSGICQRDR